MTALVSGALVGVGLALEAFLVVLANGLYGANNGKLRMFAQAFTFALCHAAALIAGYFAVRALAGATASVDVFMTRIASGALAFIGLKTIAAWSKEFYATDRVLMLAQKHEARKTDFAGFFVQSVAASFDAFAAGVAQGGEAVDSALLCAATIAAIITMFYLLGYACGKKFGNGRSRYASLLGGLIFVVLAVEAVVA